MASKNGKKRSRSPIVVVAPAPAAELSRAQACAAELERVVNEFGCEIILSCYWENGQVLPKCEVRQREPAAVAGAEAGGG